MFWTYVIDFAPAMELEHDADNTAHKYANMLFKRS